MNELKTVSPYFSSYEEQPCIYERPLCQSEALGETIKRLTFSKNVGRYFVENTSELGQLLDVVAASCQRAYQELDEESMRQVQRGLFNIYEQFVARPAPGCEMNGLNWVIARIKAMLEEAWIGYELRRTPHIPASFGPDIAVEIQRTIHTHPSNNHQIFTFLQREASREQMYHYFVSDYPLNVKFYDLIALSLVGSDPTTRMEVAGNLWDEMGRGDGSKTHLQLYSNVLLELGLETSPQRIASRMSGAALVGYNMLLYLAINRDQYFRQIGAMAVTELSDPEQYKKLLDGCTRVGLKSAETNMLAFYEEHIETDSTHGDGWVRNVIVPVVNRYPTSREAILEGCYFRLNTAKDYWDSLMDDMRLRRALEHG